MYKQKLKALLIAAAALLATGCMDNPLDLDNPNQRTVEAFWQNEADAIAGMNAVYRTLLNNGLYGRNRYWMWGRTDTYLSRSPAGAIQNSVRGIITDYNYGGFLNGMWTNPWEGIFRANQVIHLVPEIEEMDPSLRSRLVAEARFIRALYHFEQVLLFGDVPIVLELPTTEDQPVFRPANEVYGQVITDALAAADVLPWTYSGSDIGRATRGGALALAAETHMMLGQWAQAVPLLEQIVNSGQYSLVPDFATLFTLDGDHTVESLFEAAFGTATETAQGARGNVNPRLVAPSSGLGSSIGFNDIQPTDWAFEQFFVEGSYPDNPDPRLEYTIFWNDPNAPGGRGMDVFGMPFADRYATTGPDGQGGFRDTLLDDTFFLKKYQEYWRTSLTDFNNPLNIKIYRLGKVLLLLAEALTETGDVGGAATHLNTLRARVDLPPVPAMNQAEMRDWIDREFVLELMWEHSSRLKYLKRHGKLNRELLMQRNVFHGQLFENGKHELIPIMQTEMDRNPNAVQNPGW